MSGRLYPVFGAAREVLRDVLDSMCELDPIESDPRDRVSGRELCKTLAERRAPKPATPKNEEEDK